MKRLLKFWSLPRREKQFFCEAGILLLLSNFCVKAIAFRHIDSFLRARWSASCDYDHADDVKLVNLSLARAANLLPWQSLCLSRSIVAFIMLRRRGICAVLCAGVRFLENSSLGAHAWVRTDRGEIERNSENSAFTVVVTIGEKPLVADSARFSTDGSWSAPRDFG
jgi:hypothetical protein